MYEQVEAGVEVVEDGNRGRIEVDDGAVDCAAVKGAELD